jgi:hypothetical protein
MKILNIPRETISDLHLANDFWSFLLDFQHVTAQNVTITWHLEKNIANQSEADTEGQQCWQNNIIHHILLNHLSLALEKKKPLDLQPLGTCCCPFEVQTTLLWPSPWGLCDKHRPCMLGYVWPFGYGSVHFGMVSIVSMVSMGMFESHKSESVKLQALHSTHYRNLLLEV